MGQILEAKCAKCGFKKEVLFGGGMMGGGTICNFPAINKKTGKMVVRNYYKAPKPDQNIIFYDDPVMYKGEISSEDYSWDDLGLKKDGNLCPVCKEFQLSFNGNMCFD
jgi:hypothetical protein